MTAICEFCREPDVDNHWCDKRLEWFAAVDAMFAGDSDA